jgi:hypothetical protein
MQEFIAKHREEIAGVRSGFDRLIFRGTLRSISYPEGMMGYLWAKQVRLTEFGRHVLRVSERLKQACQAKAEALRRPMKYLASAGESKEEVARGIAAPEKIEEGLVCVLSCVEPCQTGDSKGKKSWRVLRGGVADLHRRAQISERAAERYLDALAGVDQQTTLQELLDRLGQPKQWKGRRVRALHPLAGDRALLETICRGEFMLSGFRNRDLQKFFFAEATPDLREARRRSAWVSRKLRLLRAHGIIRKVPGTYRYQLSETGRKAVAALLTALRSTVRELIPEAA